MNKEIYVIDLFCGMGGASIGFQEAGFKIALGVDIDQSALDNYAHNIGAPILKKDLTKTRPSTLLKKAGLMGKIDTTKQLIIIGCPPCQGFSRLGPSKEDDPRNELVRTFMNIIRYLKPACVVFENVATIEKHESYIDHIHEILSKNRYHIGISEVHDLRDFGVPQRRKRFITVAFLNGGHAEKFSFLETHSKDGLDGLKLWNTVRDAISDLPVLKAGEKSEVMNHEAGFHLEKTMKLIRKIPEDGGSRKDLPKRMLYDCHKNMKGFNDVLGRMKWDEPAPTMTGGCTNPTKGRFLHPEQNRAITIREAARLQTFQDSVVFLGKKGDITTQIGNALPPLYAQKTAAAIKRAVF